VLQSVSAPTSPNSIAHAFSVIALATLRVRPAPQPASMTALAACRGGWRAARAGASGRARCSALAHAAPLHARAAGGAAAAPGRTWLAAAVAPSAVAAAPAWRCCRFRSLAASPVCAAAAGDQLPATFVAPSKVNMDDYPPPKRPLNKGAGAVSARRRFPDAPAV
jgi:hypothetical protein